MEQRARIFDKTERTVLKHYFDPAFNGFGWPEHARQDRQRLIAIKDPEAFELAMHDLVRSLGTSHTGFFHQSVRRVPARLAIGANFRKVETPAASNGLFRMFMRVDPRTPPVSSHSMC